MKFKIFILTSMLLLLILAPSCTSCSRSGRAQIIAMAKKEGSKKKTIPEPNTIIKDISPKIIEIEDVLTPNEKININKELVKNKIPKAEGNLIQVEGLVLKEVRELTIKLGTTSSQLDQISKMKKHVQKEWHYIYDPATGHDTWRSAEATISLKYQGKYSGDCDDYAILLASFARQIGLNSRVVGGCDGDSGHAFAEFEIKKTDLKSRYLKGFDFRILSGAYWISLDWFSGKEHNRFTHNTEILNGI